MTTERAQAPSATAQIASTAVTALRESARRHKVAAAIHRRAAQADMQALDRLARECARLGIRLEVVTAEGGTDDGR